jgi:hypothetical protein
MELIFFYSLIVLFIIGYAMHNKFLNTLQEKYPSIWVSLGSPTLFANNTPQNGFAIQRYIFKKEYKTLNDGNFISFCNLLRTFGIFYLCYFFSGVLIFLVSLILKRL